MFTYQFTISNGETITILRKVDLNLITHIGNSIVNSMVNFSLVLVIKGSSGQCLFPRNKMQVIVGDLAECRSKQVKIFNVTESTEMRVCR